MEKKINIAEILKDCPKGMELDCALFENLEFDHIDKNSGAYSIICRVKREWGGYNVHTFTEYGGYSTEKYSKCVIFPKGKTTWEGFQRPFKDGDICYVNFNNYYENIFIFKEIYEHNYIKVYVDLHCNSLLIDCGTVCTLDCREEIRFATEKEKEKLFKAIKENGYKWNAETKTLEKSVKPKFKVGDRIIHKVSKTSPFTITEITDTSYKGGYRYEILIEQQDNFELVPNKFDIFTLKPFESRVLVRNIGAWKPAFWGYYSKECAHPFAVVSGNIFTECIPYEGNEHLLGKTDDCDEYYKTWE